jgi:hypothetical protein
MTEEITISLSTKQNSPQRHEHLSTRDNKGNGFPAVTVTADRYNSLGSFDLNGRLGLLLLYFTKFNSCHSILNQWL